MSHITHARAARLAAHIADWHTRDLERALAPIAQHAQTETMP